MPLTHSDTVGALVGFEVFDDPHPEPHATTTAARATTPTSFKAYNPSAVAIPSRSAPSTTASEPATYRSSSTGSDQL